MPRCQAVWRMVWSGGVIWLHVPDSCQHSNVSAATCMQLMWRVMWSGVVWLHVWDSCQRSNANAATCMQLMRRTEQEGEGLLEAVDRSGCANVSGQCLNHRPKYSKVGEAVMRMR